MKLLKITQSKVDDLKRRVLTMWNGNKNTVTAVQYGGYGVDSNPVKNSIGAYETSEMDGKEACLGIMNTNAKAELGEHRLFCTDAQGVFKFNVWLRADGTALIGDSEVPAAYINWFVKYTELDTALQAMVVKVNTENAKIAAAIGAIIPGLYTPVAVTVNIANAKNTKVKTI